MNSIDIYKCKLVREDTVNYEPISCSNDVIKLVRNVMKLHECAEEHLWMVAFNTKGVPVGFHEVGHGTINQSMAEPREIFKRAFLNNAAAIILIHNHPSGNPEPSNSDIEMSKKMVNIGDLLGIRVLDHIIAAESNYISLKAENYI